MGVGYSWKETAAGRIRIYTLTCLMCERQFESPLRKEPTCSDRCWRKLLQLWKAGKKIEGLADRNAGLA